MSEKSIFRAEGLKTPVYAARKRPKQYLARDKDLYGIKGASQKNHLWQWSAPKGAKMGETRMACRLCKKPQFAVEGLPCPKR